MFVTNYQLDAHSLSEPDSQGSKPASDHLGELVWWGYASFNGSLKKWSKAFDVTYVSDDSLWCSQSTCSHNLWWYYIIIGIL